MKRVDQYRTVLGTFSLLYRKDEDSAPICGVYVLVDEHFKVLFVGKSTNVCTASHAEIEHAHVMYYRCSQNQMDKLVEYYTGIFLKHKNRLHKHSDEKKK